MRTKIFIIIGILALNYSYAQEADSIIYWENDVKLKWADFKGIPLISETNEGFEHMAAVTAMITAVPIEKEWGYSYTVINYFVKNKSWARDTSSLKLLTHEQTHFNIAEVYARKMRKCICELEKNKEKDPNKYIEIVNKLLYELNEENSLYDKETYFGVSEEKQQEWNEKIVKQLNELDKYEVDYNASERL